MARKLKDAGCYLDSSGAEHDRWYSPITDAFFYVPRHQSREVPKGTLRRLQKEAGI
ncbi:type II toxin-antitoxin system HicA family toxin [bacterium]|nr:type II toxin-antitoxin system HicA family toxin [bacterium]